MKNLIVAFLCLMSCQALHAQKKYDANWVFGFGCGIDWNDPLHPRTFHANCYNINITNTLSDSTGRLLMHFTGLKESLLYTTLRFQVNDVNNSINLSDTIFAGWPISRASFWYSYNSLHTLIYQGFQGDSSLFVDNLNRKLMVASFDSNLVLQQKNVPIFDTLLTLAMTVVQHVDGKSWWLIAHKSAFASPDSNNRYYFFLVTEKGIVLHHYQDIGTQFLHHGNIYQGAGCMITSSKGDKIAVTTDFNLYCEIFDLDRCTGLLSNPKVIQLDSSSNTGIEGLAFSPSGRYIYIENSGFVPKPSRIYQFDLDSSSWNPNYNIIYIDSAMIPNRNIYRNQYIFAALARDNKIYWAATDANFSYYTDSTYSHNSKYLCVINDPDSPGIKCNFRPFSFYLGDSSYTSFDLPRFPNYNLGTISIYQASVGRDTFYCKGDTTIKGVYLGVDTVLGVTYQWQLGPTLDTDQVHRPKVLVKPPQSTWYYVTLTDTSIHGSCQSRTDSVYVEVRVCNGIEEVSTNHIKVYPNPASQQLTVEGDIHQPTIFTLQDVLGRTIMQITLTANRTQLDISHLPNGVYFYRVDGVGGKVMVLR